MLCRTRPCNLRLNGAYNSMCNERPLYLLSSRPWRVNNNTQRDHAASETYFLFLLQALLLLLAILCSYFFSSFFSSLYTNIRDTLIYLTKGEEEKDIKINMVSLPSLFLFLLLLLLLLPFDIMLRRERDVISWFGDPDCPQAIWDATSHDLGHIIWAMETRGVRRIRQLWSIDIWGLPMSISNRECKKQGNLKTFEACC